MGNFAPVQTSLGAVCILVVVVIFIEEGADDQVLRIFPTSRCFVVFVGWCCFWGVQAVALPISKEKKQKIKIIIFKKINIFMPIVWSSRPSEKMFVQFFSNLFQHRLRPDLQE